MDSAEELLKYITERVVSHMQTPKENKRQQRSRQRETWSYRWFGMLPAAFLIWFVQIKQMIVKSPLAKFRDFRFKERNFRFKE